MNTYRSSARLCRALTVLFIVVAAVTAAAWVVGSTWIWAATAAVWLVSAWLMLYAARKWDEAADAWDQIEHIRTRR